MFQEPILICRCDHLKELHTDKGCIVCEMQGRKCPNFVQAGEMIFLTGLDDDGNEKPTTIH